jgi:hypothetical protein
MQNIRWVKSPMKEWLPLESVDLANVHTIGIYIIWHAGRPPKVVKVGQGNIRQRLNDHKIDPMILAFKKYGSLFVTWAVVGPHLLDGVERYLADMWGPEVGERYPDVIPIAVNSPWS